VRLASPGTCYFAPGNICPGRAPAQPALFSTCNIPMPADTGKQGLWELALPCMGGVSLLGSVFQQDRIRHIIAVIYTHIFTPLNSKMAV